METTIRKRLISSVTFLAGLYFFMEFVLPTIVLEKMGLTPSVHSSISTGFVVVGTMAVGLGIINLLMVHGSTIIFRRKNWINSIALLLGLFVMLFVASNDWFADLEIASRTNRYSVLANFAKKIEVDSARIVSEREKEDGTPESIKVPAVSVRTNALLTAATEASGVCISERAELEEQIARQKEPALTALQKQLTELTETCEQLPAQIESFVVPHDEAAVDAAAFSAMSKSLNDVAVLQGKMRRELSKTTLTGHLWNFLFRGLYENLGAAMFSILGVYIAAAAFRAFRVKSLESFLMMFAAVIVMLGQIPFGIWLWDALPEFRLWLLQYPNSAAFRAVKFGASVAMLVMAFRMWLSLESDYSGTE